MFVFNWVILVCDFIHHLVGQYYLFMLWLDDLPDTFGLKGMMLHSCSIESRIKHLHSFGYLMDEMVLFLIKSGKELL